MIKAVICLHGVLSEVRSMHRELYDTLTPEEIGDLVVDVALLLVDRNNMLISLHQYGDYVFSMYPFDEYDRLEIHEILVFLATELERVYDELNLFTPDGKTTRYVPQDFHTELLIVEEPNVSANVIFSDTLASFRLKQCSRH